VVGRNELESSGDILERFRSDVIALKRNHLAVLTATEKIGCGCTEPGGENPIIGRRRTSPLLMAEYRDACFHAVGALDLLLELIAL